ncbi:MAG: Rod binding domain-containing protein [Planctomycetota bacterium]|jgi:Rod binding domain-containing protein
MDINSLNASITGKLDQANLNVEKGNLQRAMNDASSKNAGDKFEAMLGTMLAKEMRKGLDEGFFGKGPGADSFSSWLDEYVGQVMAEQGTLGTGAMVNHYVSQVEDADIAPDAATGSVDETVPAGTPSKVAEVYREAE